MEIRLHIAVIRLRIQLRIQLRKMKNLTKRQLLHLYQCEESVSNAILILRVDITPFAKQAVQEVSDMQCGFGVVRHYVPARMVSALNQNLAQTVTLPGL